VTRFSFDVLQDKVAQQSHRGKSEREMRRLARKEMLANSPLSKAATPATAERPRGLSFIKRGLAKLNQSFGSGSASKPSTPDTRSFSTPPPVPESISSYDSCAMPPRTDSNGAVYSTEPTMSSPNAPPDEEARLLQKRTLHYLHLHLRRFCPTASPEQCLDWYGTRDSL